MKILHVIPHYFPSSSFGGSPISTSQMAAEQVRQGHQVDILTTTVQDPKDQYRLGAEELHPDGYRILRAKNLSNWLAYRFKFHLAPGVFAFFWQKAGEYDVIHLHEYRTVLNVAAALLKWRTKATYILQPHGVFQNFGGKEHIKTIFDFFFQPSIDKSIDKVVAISQKELDLLEDHFGNKVTLLYHGITQPAAVAHPIEDLPKKFIVFVGRLHQVKRIDYLIKAYAQSTLRKKNIHLVIAGNDDGELKKLKRLVIRLHIHGYVHYIGPVNAQEKYQLFRQALANMYVTHEEPFGRVPLEAATVGCWSIISQSSGVAELLPRMQFADAIEGCTIKELTAKMEEVIRLKKRVEHSERRKIMNMTWQKQASLLEMLCKVSQEKYESEKVYGYTV